MLVLATCSLRLAHLLLLALALGLPPPASAPWALGRLAVLAACLIPEAALGFWFRAYDCGAWGRREVRGGQLSSLQLQLLTTNCRTSNLLAAAAAPPCYCRCYY
jgi:hypothetical protein